MGYKMSVKELITDPKHWVGWILTTGALVGVFLFLPRQFMESFLAIILAAFGTIVIVDIVKHQVGLQ